MKWAFSHHLQLLRSTFLSCTHIDCIVSVLPCILAPWQASEDVCKNLQQIKIVLYGAENQEPQADQVAALSHEMYDTNMIYMLVQHLAKIDFEVYPNLALVIIYY